MTEQENISIRGLEEIITTAVCDHVILCKDPECHVTDIFEKSLKKFFEKVEI